MKACFLLMRILMRSFHLTWRGSRRNQENSGKTGLPAASRIFSVQSETRLKISEEESGHLFFVSRLLKTLVKFSLYFGPGKVSL